MPFLIFLAIEQEPVADANEDFRQIARYTQRKYAEWTAPESTVFVRCQYQHIDTSPARTYCLQVSLRTSRAGWTGQKARQDPDTLCLQHMVAHRPRASFRSVFVCLQIRLQAGTVGYLHIAYHDNRPACQGTARASLAARLQHGSQVKARHSERENIMRRNLLFGILIIILGMGLVACGASGAADPEEEPMAEEEMQDTDGDMPMTRYHQAPMLNEAVTSGALPPVDDRLPQDPLVIEPVESIGSYGGTWRRLDNSDGMGLTRQVMFVEPFLKWHRDANGMRPNLAESWAYNDEGTELTVNFRKGIRWSDGEPLNVDDYLFWWNDLVMDEDVPVAAPNGTIFQGEPMQVAKVDDFTLHFTFPIPAPLFMEQHSRGHYHSAAFVVPEHFLKDFHPAYSDATENDELLAYYDIGSRLQKTDMPMFSPWIPVEFTSGQTAVFERNPYYWKVDPEGNQLPYIDRMVVDIVASTSFTESVALKTIAGEVDLQVRDIAPKDVPLILENAEAGNYQVYFWNRGDYSWPWLILKYDYDDEAIVDLFYNDAFRRGLSHAIDRERINEIVSLGLGKARSFALSPESPEFQTERGQQVYEAWATAYAAHDPALAQALLDEAGVTDQDGDGFRDMPNGDPLELVVHVSVSDQNSVDAMDLIKEDWAEVGIQMVLNAVEWSVIMEEGENRGIMIHAWGSAAAWGLVSAATVWTPVESVSYALGGIHVGRYYQTGGADGIAPRAGSALEKLQNAYTQLITIVDPVEREARLLDAYQIHIDDGPVSIGIVGEHISPLVVKNNFHNVPETGGIVASWDLGFPGSADPEQFYMTAE